MTKKTTVQPPNRLDCPGCGSLESDQGPILENQPVMMHSLCSSSSEAKVMAKGTLHLKECHECGLIFNAALDVELLNYDSSYDNRQGFSPTFRAHLNEVAELIGTGFLGEHGKVLEVGCGKGEFLRLLKDRGATRIVGFDTSAPVTGTAGNEGIDFFQSYVIPSDIKESFDVIVCRHVVEHVPELREFFELLAALSKSAGNAVVVVETPAFEWIADNNCFWDYFYEHCNYFTIDCLSYLAKSAGFEVEFHNKVFGDQYQIIALRPTERQLEPQPSRHRRLLRFLRGVTVSERRLRSEIADLSNGGKWAIWGAGAKGVTLAARLKDEQLLCAIDANPAKANRWLPGSGIQIISPEKAPFDEIGLVVIANPIYEREILQTLGDNNYRGKTKTI
jgi:SAM-dependent methyltransferase